MEDPLIKQSQRPLSFGTWMIPVGVSKGLACCSFGIIDLCILQAI